MVITVQCPECATSFPVDPAKVPVGGVKARCSSCSAIFRVERPDEAVPTAPAPAPPLAEPDMAPPSTEPDVVPRSAEPDVVPPSAEDLEVEDQWAHDASAEEPEEPSEPAGWQSRGTVSVERPEVPVAPESMDDWVFETEEDTDPDILQIEPVGTLEESLEDAKDEVSSFGPDLAQESDVEVVDTGEASPLDADLGLEGTYEGGATDELEGFLASPDVVDVEDRSSLDMDFLPAFEAEVVEPEPVEGVIEPEPVEGVTEPEPVEGVTEPEPVKEAIAEPESDSAYPSVAEAGADRDEAAPPAAGSAAGPVVQGFTFGRRDPHDKARRLARVLVSDIITYNPDRHHRALSAGSLKEDFEEEIEKSWKEYLEQVGPDIAHNTQYWSQALNDVLAKGQEIF